MRDIFFHTQWCAALAMVAVQWPRFVCKFPHSSGSPSAHFSGADPLLAQTSWATLTYSKRVALVQISKTKHFIRRHINPESWNTSLEPTHG